MSSDGNSASEYVPVIKRDYCWAPFPYQLLLAAAAVRAVWRESRGHGGWEKTTHTNSHRTTTPKRPVPA